MDIQAAPGGYNYDIRGLYFFEVYPDGKVSHVRSDKGAIRDKTADSLYSAYFRALNRECVLYVAENYYDSAQVLRIDALDELADSIGIQRETGHEHKIHAKFSEQDEGTGRFARVDVEFLCGCKLCSSNARAMTAWLREKYGWQVALNSINSMPLSSRTITVERKSCGDLSKIG